MKKIGIFDPYLNTLGGGERYILSIASCLAQQSDVSIFWDDDSILLDAEKKFNIPLAKVQFTANIFSKHTSLFKRFLQERSYDAIFYMSDGSIPFLHSKNNILIFQFPVNWVKGNNARTILKLRKINRSLVYSDFVKQYIDKTFGITSLVLPPPITSEFNKNVKKENIIMTVGRFTQGMNTKKQEVLIEAFKQFYDKGNKKWTFYIIGSYLDIDAVYVDRLIQQAKGYPIKIVTDMSFKQLSEIYQKAKIYWHAAGYGEDLEMFPHKAEHFGITTVEAMQNGVVPVVINAGGQKEIVEDKRNGLVWNTQEELISYTIRLTKSITFWKQLSKHAIQDAKEYNMDIFCKKVNALLI